MLSWSLFCFLGVVLSLSGIKTVELKLLNICEYVYMKFHMLYTCVSNLKKYGCWVHNFLWQTDNGHHMVSWNVVILYEYIFQYLKAQYLPKSKVHVGWKLGVTSFHCTKYNLIMKAHHNTPQTIAKTNKKEWLFNMIDHDMPVICTNMKLNAC